MKVKVRVDPKLCIGSGSCVVIASKYFELNKKGKAEFKQSTNENTKGKELQQLIESARSCPTQAITIVDENGKKIY